MNDTAASQIKEEDFPSDETKKQYEDIVSLLFKKAKDQDEKEFISAILYFRGILTYSRAYDVSRELEDTIELFFKIALLKNTKPAILSLQNFFKLGLLVYCHIIESYPVLEFLYNMNLLAQGKNYELHPFEDAEDKPLNKEKVNDLIKQLCHEMDFEKQKQLISKLAYTTQVTDMPVIARIQKIIKESKKAGIAIDTLLEDFYDKDIRNAFSHSLYGLDSKGMMLIKHNRHISYRDLLEKITKCLHFYTTLASKANDVLEALHPNKQTTFRGRLGEMNITPITEKGYVSYQIESTSLSKHI